MKKIILLSAIIISISYLLISSDSPSKLINGLTDSEIRELNKYTNPNYVENLKKSSANNLNIQLQKVQEKYQNFGNKNCAKEYLDGWNRKLKRESAAKLANALAKAEARKKELQDKQKAST